MNPRRQRRKQLKTNQRGITLLLGILVLSAILAISFSLATVVFVEVRSSGDLLRTETSYYAATAVGEEALWKLKRKVNQGTSVNQCDPSLINCYSSTVGTVDVGSTPPAENILTDPVQQDVVPANGIPPDAHTFPANAKYYVLYDPACPTANPSSTGTCQQGGSGYSSITVTYLSTGNLSTDALHMYVCQFNPTYLINSSGAANTYSTQPCSDRSPTAPNDSYWLISDQQLFPNNPANMTFTVPLDHNQQQELVLYDTSIYSSVYVQIESFDDSSPAQPKGIPYYEERAVDINAKNFGVTRKLRVYVPNN